MLRYELSDKFRLSQEGAVLYVSVSEAVRYPIGTWILRKTCWERISQGNNNAVCITMVR